MDISLVVSLIFSVVFICITLYQIILNRAMKKYSNGDLNGAIADLTILVKYTPRHWRWRPLLIRGAYFAMNNYLDKGIADFTQLIAINPRIALAYNNRGYSYCTLGKYEQALEDCNRALKIKPNLFHAYGSRGQTYFLMNRFADALADFQVSNQLKPDHKMAIAGQAMAYHALKQPENAKKLWQSLLILDSEYQNPNKMKTEFQCADDFLEAARTVATLYN